jgi:hypothetical protein
MTPDEEIIEAFKKQIDAELASGKCNDCPAFKLGCPMNALATKALTEDITVQEIEDAILKMQFLAALLGH